MRQAGFSFVELMAVVVILGIVAAAALPSFSEDYSKLDIATEELTNAIRFARAEAIRTKISYGIQANISNNQLKVYSLATATPSYTVYHPIDKKLYTIALNDRQTQGVSLTSTVFAYSGSISSASLMEFNSNGAPKYTNSGNDYLLTNATLTLTYKNQQRVLSIAPMTGRVTVQ